MDNLFSTSEILQLLQNLTNIVYLTRLDADDKVKVSNYMTDIERELGRIKLLVAKLPLNEPLQIN